MAKCYRFDENEKSSLGASRDKLNIIIQQNKDYDTDICCATGSKDCNGLNNYDCVGAALEKTLGSKEEL